MKKQDGYVMVLVLVVILVLSIVSAGLMALSVANVKNQRNSIERMQDKYTAQGMIEQTIAKLSQGGKEIPLSNEIHYTNETEQVEKDLTQWLKDTYDLEAQEIEIVAEGDDALVCESFSYIAAGTAQQGTTRIDYSVEISGSFEESGKQDVVGKTRYDMTVKKITYLSYDITTSSQGGGQ